MIVRRATDADSGAIAAIWNREIRDGVSTFNAVEKTEPEVALLIQQREGAFWVAETDGAVAGFATFGPFRSGVGYVHTAEHTVYLDALARGQGGGRLLMSELLQGAREGEIHALVAGIGSENHGAIAFHKTLGFSEVGRLPETGRKFGRWMDLVLMQKTL